MTKCKKCFSLSEDCIATISRISSQTATPESVIAEKYLTHSISQEVELTAAERYHFRRKYINDSIDSVLRLFGIIEINGGIQDKFRAALYLGQGNVRGKNRQYRNGIMETSLFEILESIREWDNNVWKDLTIHMAYFGKIRKRYFYLYPICEKKGMKVKNEEIRTNNNTITIPVTQSPVTQSTQHEKSLLEKLSLPELSDEEYLKQKRHERYLKEKESQNKPKKQP